MKTYRHIPGPAGELSLDETAASAAQQQSAPPSTLDASDFEWFWKRALQKMLGAGIDDSVFEKLSTVGDIENGFCDLRVSNIILLVAEVQHCLDGSCLLRLKDTTGTIQGVIGKRELASLGRIERGSLLFLQRVAVLVGKSPFARYLNIHPQSISYVYHLENRKRSREDR